MTREVLGELGQGQKHQPPWAFRWLPAAGEEVRELGVRKNRPEPVAQVQIGIAKGKGRAVDGCCRGRNITA